MKMTEYPLLSSSIKIGNVTFRNRIIASPTSVPKLSPEGFLTKQNIAYFALKAKGGAAGVTLGDTIVHRRSGQGRRTKIAIEDPQIMESLTDVARAIREFGAVPSLELTHYGIYAHVRRLETPPPPGCIRFGPSERVASNGLVTPAMTVGEIEMIADAFGAAAARAKDAGFLMVSVHGGHGWLLGQFMSAASNHRTDEYGGSLENRMRFPLLVVERIRAAVGPGFPIEFRISGAEYSAGGYGIEEGVEIAKMLDGKVDLIHVSAGHHEYPDTFILTHPSMFYDHGCNVHLAAEIKKAVRTPVACIGGLSDPAQMERILASGQADIIEMGRGLIADPFLPRKVRTGRAEDVVKCMRCFQCMSSLAPGRTMDCSLNPVIGREMEFLYNAYPPPAERCRVLVAGGGPGGMLAAVTAAERGHSVVLCERDGRLGGKLRCERWVDFKQDLYDYVGVLERRLERAGVEVRLNTTVTPELVREMAPDALVAALGAEPVVPPIPGIDDPRVMLVTRLGEDSYPEIGRRVVILGGGLVGSETAVHLLRRGHDVTVVEMGDDFARDAVEEHKTGLRIQFEKGVKLHLNTRGVEINAAGLVCEGPDGARFTLPADTIFCAVGLRPNTAAVDPLRELTPWFQDIGDCVRAGRVVNATNEGYYAALNI